MAAQPQRERAPRAEPNGSRATTPTRSAACASGSRTAVAPPHRRATVGEPAYRIGVGIVGSLVVALGIVAIPLPGPGWLIVIAGLFVLATEFSGPSGCWSSPSAMSRPGRTG